VLEIYYASDIQGAPKSINKCVHDKMSLTSVTDRFKDMNSHLHWSNFFGPHTHTRLTALFPGLPR